MAHAIFEHLKNFFQTHTSIINLKLLIYLTILTNAPLKDNLFTGKSYPHPVLSIDALLDFCDAYDDGPFHISRCLFARTFLRSVYS